MRQAQALGVMMGGANVFLTGAPGAGKTYLLNSFIGQALAAGKTVAVTASTGIAATHIGGTTIHSWSGTGIKDSLTASDLQKLSSSAKLVKRYNGTDVLVIDEVSMLHGQRLDMLNVLAKRLRQSTKPFGGLQVILVGDMFQLPPVNRSSDIYDFAHSAKAWQELALNICYLTEQHRQRDTDGLLDLLIAMRRGDLQPEHYAALEARLNQQPPGQNQVTQLYAHNLDVDALNQRQLSALPGKSKIYTMQTSGRAAKIEQLSKSVLAPAELELKLNAQVMFVANDFAKGFINGSRGVVTGYDGDFPVVKLSGSSRRIKVEPHSWALEEDGRKVAEVTQLPLRLAWAITIHKSQGMSLDAAQIDLSRTFMPGMGYVALSRIRSLGGIYLRGINNMALTLHPEIYQFDNDLRTSSDSLAKNLADYTPKVTKAPKQKPVDEKLLQQLKTWRRDRAKQDGVSAFIVAHNSLLDAIASRKPQTAPQLLGLPGFGAGKLQKYGLDIIKITTNK